MVQKWTKGQEPWFSRISVGEWGVVQEKKKQLKVLEKKKQKQKTYATLVEGGILICW